MSVDDVIARVIAVIDVTVVVMPQVLTTLQAGLNAEPHQVFLKRLGQG